MDWRLLKMMCRLLFALILSCSAAAGSGAFISLRSGARCTSLQIIHHDDVIIPDDIDITVIFENHKLVAINKPPHIPHHDDPSTGQLGIMSIIRAQQEQLTFPYPDRLWGVHRLDKVTSGILLLAKDSSTASQLINKFQQKEITKFYIAISGKKPKKKKQGWVKGVMKLGRRGSYKLINEKSKDDNNKDKRYAVTRFFTAGLGNLSMAPTILKSIEKSKANDMQLTMPKTAILFRPYTGKTHQLRVASKSCAIPILGDIRYGGGRLDITLDGGKDWSRTYLHASAIHFQLDDEEITIWSSPPFAHLFATSELSNADNVFVSLMEKHCDCPQIIDTIHKSKINEA